ncbi:MAG: hypothetical protein PF630_09775 [Gammaproteobacteria bacterium]|jgi:methylthioribose-1-phosphate isomerase|nr:hypothetical protein [Gammaproteobacteria bacterium]
MNSSGTNLCTIRSHPDAPAVVQIIDQHRLPQRYVVCELSSYLDGVLATRAHSSPLANHGFDMTPPRRVTGLITGHGICPVGAAGPAGLFLKHTGA